ncbi:sigma-70 family RNA polymerase sigma factor [Maricaulis sp.]|uniref:sigma-70 family RNA polymerase sigma factor n=1 Tax=Maricaulis sp. TaxID=1486257 RepID=UPI002602BF7D|nr:sigma-70 family RNA polymerase sigma factor [Maricaulis sp.]
MTQQSDRLRPPSETARLALLLDRVGRGRDRDAFRALFDHFAPRVRSFLVNRRVTPAQADDLTQDVMLTVWRRASSYDRSKASAATWIYTIARNLHIDHYRKTVRAQKLDGADPVMQPDAAPIADELVSRSQDAGTVTYALAELPEDQRIVLDLAFVEGLSHSEIAARLDLPLGTVKSRVRLAMNKLRQTLGELK